MNSKSIGNIGEAKVLAKLVELGIPVYLPFGDNEKADLIAEFNGKLNKIQIKTSTRAKNGKITFGLTSSTSHRKNGGTHVYDSSEIDFFACYNTVRDKIYLISINDSPDNHITIRYENPKNNQFKGINFEEKYLIDNVLCLN